MHANHQKALPDLKRQGNEWQLPNFWAWEAQKYPALLKIRTKPLTQILYKKIVDSFHPLPTASQGTTYSPCAKCVATVRLTPRAAFTWPFHAC